MAATLLPGGSDSFIMVEIIAVQRAWALYIYRNALRIALIDGPSDDVEGLPSDLLVEARVQLIPPSEAASSAANCELEFLLPRARLNPSAQAQGHPWSHPKTLSLSPCFPCGPIASDGSDADGVYSGFDDARLLHDGDLLFELSVHLRHPPPPQSLPSTPKIRPTTPTSTISLASPYFREPSVDSFSSSSIGELESVRFSDFSLPSDISVPSFIGNNDTGSDRWSHVSLGTDGDGEAQSSSADSWSRLALTDDEDG